MAVGYLRNAESMFRQGSGGASTEVSRCMRTSVIFAIALASLGAYLVAVNWGFDLNLSVFWLSVLLLSAVPIYQIAESDVVTGSSEKIILIEIILMTLAFRLIWVLPFATSLREADPHYDYYATTLIMRYGWSGSLEFLSLWRTGIYLEWPMLHILTAMTSNITGIDLLELVRYFPLMYGPFSLPLFYLFAKATYNDTRTGLLASYGMSALFQYVAWDSKFLRESLATGIFWLVLYVSLKVQGSSKNRGFGILAIIGVVSLVLCHHLTTVMLILFGLVSLGIGWLSRRRRVAHFLRLERPEHRLRYLSLLFVVLAMVTTIVQWRLAGGQMGVGDWLLVSLADLAEQFTSSTYGRMYVYGLISPRVAVSLYGNVVFVFIAGCIFLYHVRQHRCINAYTDFALGIWGFLVAALGVFFVSVQALANYMEVNRLQKFGWPFILIITAHGVLTFRRKKICLVLLFTLFVILQVFTIPPNYYTRSIGPDYDYGRVRGYYVAEEYAAVDWLNSDKVVGDQAVNELLGGLKQVPVQNVDLKDDQLHFPPDYLFFYRMEDSRSMLLIGRKSIMLTRVVIVRSEALDGVANRLYASSEVTIYGFFGSSCVRTGVTGSC